MKTVVIATLLAALAGCGVETAGTAATAAAIKKQELDQGKKTMEQAQQRINDATQLQQQRADEGENQSK
jgi:curli biogenesis system outer membrane secretion channel CsgG